MKDNSNMIYAIAISSAVASGIMNYKEQTKTPEPTAIVIKSEEPKPPQPEQPKPVPPKSNTK